MNKPLISLDTIAPRKILLKFLGYDWQSDFEDFLKFRSFLEQKAKIDPQLSKAGQAFGKNGFNYDIFGSSCCGIQQLSLQNNFYKGSLHNDKQMANLLTWLVCNSAPNLIYWAGDTKEYEWTFKLLEKFGFTWTRRPFNLIHSHFMREYQISYDYMAQENNKKDIEMIDKAGLEYNYMTDRQSIIAYTILDLDKRKPEVALMKREDKNVVGNASPMPKMPF